MRTSKNACSKNLNALSRSSIFFFFDFFNLFLDRVQHCIAVLSRLAHETGC